MDASSFFKADSFRNFVAITLPGYLATWPLLYFIIMKFQIDFNQFEFLIAFICTVVSIGVGMILEDLGGQIEIFLERKVVKNKKELDYYWRRYLLFSNGERSNELKMMKYISSIVIRMKFEFDMIAAIFTMLISQIIFQVTDFSAFENNCHLMVYVFVFFLITIYLFYEARRSIDVLHFCRKHLIDYSDNTDDQKSLTDDFINPKFEEFIK